MEKSKLAPKVSALVLDSPVLDWRKILEFNATEMGLPGLSALPVEWAIGARIDANWDSLDALDQPEDFHLPILLFHGTEDDVGPDRDQRRVRRRASPLGHLLPGPEAGHTQAWNVDPPLYEKRLRRFLADALVNETSPIAAIGLECC